MDDAHLLSEARRRLPAARTALQQCIGDIPAASGGTWASSGVSDRPGRLALTVIDGRDQAITDSRRLDHLMKLMAARCRRSESLTRQLTEVVDICDRWAPTERRKAALEANLRDAAEGKGDDGCISCARTRDHRGAPVYAEQHPGLKICKSCYDTLRRVRARDRFINAELVPLSVLNWRQRHPGKNLSDAVLDRLLIGQDA